MWQELINNITNINVFTDSLSNWISNISINSVIILIMMIFMIVGAVDKMQGNKRGYGQEFDEGFHAMGPLAIAMVGVIAAAPVLAIILKPIIVPLYQLVGADASMFATTLLASDMGGYQLAMSLAANETIGNFSGLIVGTTMGTVMVFVIPVSLSIIKKEDRGYLGAGVLAGLITVPLGCVFGGLAMNLTRYKISFVTIIINLIPVIIIAALIVIGLWVMPRKMIEGFNKFGTWVTIVVTFLTAVGVFEYETGIKFPLFNIMVEPDITGQIPLESGLLICGQIAIVLIGAFPMVKWITNKFGHVLSKVGQKLGMDEVGSAALIANLANNIPVFNMMKDMNPKSKLLNVSFAISAAFVFGDHLGFTAGINSEMIFPVIVGKLTAGVSALVLANFLAPLLLSKIEEK